MKRTLYLLLALLSVSIAAPGAAQQKDAANCKETLKLTKDGKELWIEVWADFTGQYILKLSQDRAQSVVLALVKTHGIAAARLKAFGDGPYAPVASNDAEEGRAKNRRVELVRQ